MLPAQSRMRQRDEFSLAVRRGSRTGRALVAAHLLVRRDASGAPPLVGFVVGRPVGKAVVRNRVRRRLRSLARDYLPSLPPGSLLVVRAFPQAATASQADLAAELGLVIPVLVRRQVGAGRG